MRECRGPNGSRMPTHNSELPGNGGATTNKTNANNNMNSECQLTFSFFARRFPPPTTRSRKTKNWMRTDRVAAIDTNAFEYIAASGVNGAHCMWLVIVFVRTTDYEKLEAKAEKNKTRGNHALHFFLHALCWARGNRLNGCKRNAIFVFVGAERDFASPLFWHKFASMRAKRLIYVAILFFIWKFYRMGKYDGLCWHLDGSSRPRITFTMHLQLDGISTNIINIMKCERRLEHELVSELIATI